MTRLILSCVLTIRAAHGPEAPLVFPLPQETLPAAESLRLDSQSVLVLPLEASATYRAALTPRRPRIPGLAAA